MAGLFLLLGLALAVGMSFWLGQAGRLFGAKNRYVAVFDLTTGTAGVQSGSDVTLAGQSVGRVSKIHAGRQQARRVDRPIAIEVEMLVDRSVVLYEDAYADLNAAAGRGEHDQHRRRGVGGVRGVEARVVDGVAGGVAGRRERDARRRGADPRACAPGILAQFGVDGQTLERLPVILANVEETSANMRTITGAFAGDAEPTSMSVRQTAENVRTFSANLNGAEGWSGKVDHVLTKAQSFSDTIESNGEAFAGVAEDFRGAIADARNLIGDAPAGREHPGQRGRDHGVGAVRHDGAGERGARRGAAVGAGVRGPGGPGEPDHGPRVPVGAPDRVERAGHDGAGERVRG
ncbi:MAG: hypothetical protein R3B49_00415 [Phycisphaerales bacterium]